MSSWLLTAYLITAAVMTPIFGKLSDIYSKKKVLLIIMIIYAAGVSAAGFATNIYFMLVARAIQGFGMAMFPIAFSIVREKFPREKMSIGNGVISSMTSWCSNRVDNWRKHNKLLWLASYIFYNNSYCNCALSYNLALYTY